MSLLSYFKACRNRVLRKGGSNIGVAISFGLLNQVITSGTNFFLGVFLVREMAQMEFGLYGISFAIVLFFGGVGNALVLTQMVTLLPRKTIESRLNYVSAMFYALIIFCSIAVLAAVSIYFLCVVYLDAGLVFYENLFYSTTFACVSYLAKDYYLRVSYSFGKERLAVLVNLSISLALFFLLATTNYYGVELSADLVQYAYAISNLFGALVGMYLFKIPKIKPNLTSIRDALGEAWHGGRWGLLTNIVGWVKGQSHVIIAGFLSGPATLAVLTATRILFTPAIFMLPAVSQVLLPRLCALSVSNSVKFRRLGAYLTISTSIAAFFYCFVLFLFKDSIVDWVLGEKYSNIDGPLYAWSFFIVAHVAFSIAGLLTQAERNFSHLFYANLAGCFVVFLAFSIIAEKIGRDSVVYGMAAGEMASFFIIAYFSYRQLKSTKAA